jgi:hypothetical protein
MNFTRRGCRVPHISLVFREMWDTTDLKPPVFRPNEQVKLRAVVSHISRKTSEIWATRRPLQVKKTLIVFIS